MYLMIALEEVKFGEASSTTQLVQKFINGWDGKAVANNDGVQGAIINTEPPRPVVFLHEQHWRRKRVHAWLDEPFL